MIKEPDTPSLHSLLTEGLPNFSIQEIVIKPQIGNKKLVAIWFERGGLQLFKSTFFLKEIDLSFFESKICVYGTSTFLLSLDVHNPTFVSIMCEEI